MRNDCYKIIALGLGQCSSVLPFLDKTLYMLEYDEIIFCDTGLEVPLTYEHLKVMQKFFDITILKTSFKESHPPFCTKDAKILPTRRYLRDKGIKQAIQYLGITIEEKHRINKPDVNWIVNKYPLVDLKMTRKDCQKFLLEKLGYVPCRSGCYTCKYFDRPHLITEVG